VKTSWEELLVKGLASLGFSDPGVSKRLLRFCRLVLEANQKTNLTGAKDLTSIVRDHVLDSLAPLRLVRLRSPVVDLGSGAGFPGIPAAIAFGAEDFVLVEPRAKRAEFLEEALRNLGLTNARVVKSSARGPGAQHLAGTAGTVLMRAVAEPEKALPLAFGLLKPGGALVLYRGRTGSATAAQRAGAARLGGPKIETKQVCVPGLDAVRHIWIVTKARGRRRKSIDFRA